MSKMNDSNSHRDQSLQVLNKLRRDDVFTDFTICVKEERFKVHKIVVASHSDFFRAMLTTVVFEPEDGQVTLKDVEPEAVRVILDYWYTEQMELTTDNVYSILLAASLLQAEAALEVTTEFAGANLNKDNCLGIFVFCERSNSTELAEEALIFCLAHFEDIVQGTEVLALDEEFLKKIISDDRLNVSGEGLVLELIIRWIEFDKDLRSNKLEQLVGEVRFKLIGADSLKDITHLLAKANLLSKGDSDLLKDSIKSNPRRPLSALDQNQRLYVIGGESTSFEFYDPNSDEWFQSTSMLEKVKQNLVVAISNDLIYALSDDDDETPHLYSMKENSWEYKEHLFHRPIGGFLVALDGCVYSFGKSIFDDHICTVLKYDLVRSSSTICAQMHEPRDSPGFTVHNHYIYVMGGTKIGSGHAMRSVERYDPRKDSWEFVASMRERRRSFGSCSWRGKIYVAGGIHNYTFLSMAEVYDPKQNTWTAIEPMSSPRTDFGLVALMGQIYAVGGMMQNSCTTNKVEAYDPDSSKWVEKENMPISRSKHCTIVL